MMSSETGSFSSPAYPSFPSAWLRQPSTNGSQRGQLSSHLGVWPDGVFRAGQGRGEEGGLGGDWYGGKTMKEGGWA